MALPQLRRVALLAVVATAAWMVGAPASAAPDAVTIGQLGGVGSACFANIDAVQVSVPSGTPYTVPPGRWIATSWSTEAGGNPSAPGGLLQLELWRPTSTPDQFMLVGISPVGTTNGSGTNTFALPMPILTTGGDLLGLRNITQDYGCASLGGGGTSNASAFPTAPVPGEVRTLAPISCCHINITATLEPAPPELQVEKSVVGTASQGFTAGVRCTRDTTTTVDATLPFHADGTPDAASSPSGWAVSVGGAWDLLDASLAGSTCTVTERDTGGATSVTYSCAWTAGSAEPTTTAGCPGASSGPAAAPASVAFEGTGDLGVLGVTNTFAPPPVVISPRFTG
jgi:hypothetical protein